jgi:hypothetical protein
MLAGLSARQALEIEAMCFIENEKRNPKPVQMSELDIRNAMTSFVKK